MGASGPDACESFAHPSGPRIVQCYGLMSLDSDPSEGNRRPRKSGVQMSTFDDLLPDFGYEQD